jgi:hypothetical protein
MPKRKKADVQLSTSAEPPGSKAPQSGWGKHQSKPSVKVVQAAATAATKRRTPLRAVRAIVSGPGSSLEDHNKGVSLQAKGYTFMISFELTLICVSSILRFFNQHR